MDWYLLFLYAIGLQVWSAEAQPCTELEQFVNIGHVLSMCKGSEILGSLSNEYIFEANMLNEHEFNELFENVIEVRMCVEIYFTKFKVIRFPNVIRWRSCSVGPALRIVGNDRLEKIVFNESVIFTKTRYPPVLSDMVVIRGNRKLSTEAINNITHIFHSYRFFVPRVGECAVPGRVIDLSQLNCESYYGDIAFSQDVVGELPTIGGSVDGCLVIENTLIKDIEFIKDFDFKPAHICKNRIVRNKYLCISEGLENHLRRKMNITIRDNLPKGCRKYIDRRVALFASLGCIFIILSLLISCIKLFSTT
ncbi:hypothetical protein V3C99_010908 [Haemonchus contortus]